MSFKMNATHTVQKIVEGASLNDARASPKSHIFSLQSALASIFFGFKSRWKTFAAKKQKRKKKQYQSH
jgi:hypothetical protein